MTFPPAVTRAAFALHNAHTAYEQELDREMPDTVPAVRQPDWEQEHQHQLRLDRAAIIVKGRELVALILPASEVR